MKSLNQRTHIFAALALTLCGGAGAFAQPRPRQNPPPPSPRPSGPPRVVAPAAPPVEWGEFKSEAGGFKVRLPGTPAVSEKPMQKGPVTLTRHVHLVAAGDLRIELEYFDTPPGFITPDISLEGGVSGLVNGMTADGARLLTRGAFKQAGCEGREATLALPAPPGLKPGFAWGRIYTSGQRVLLMIFTGFEDTPRTREAARVFMESFEVAGGCRAPVAGPTAVAPPVKRRVEGAADAPTGWRRIEDNALGFSVLMPGGADYEAEQSQVQPFPVTHHTFAHDGDSSFYGAEIMGDYPEGFHNRPEALVTLIDVTFYAVQKNFEPAGFVVTPLRDLKAGAFPGREFKVVSEKLGVGGRMQIFATPKRVYIFTAFGQGDAAQEPGLERFFGSIKVSQK